VESAIAAEAALNRRRRAAGSVIYGRRPAKTRYGLCHSVEARPVRHRTAAAAAAAAASTAASSIDNDRID